MKKITINKIQISGQGLIEALIAIAVAGIACLIFLELAAQNISEVTTVETTDKMAKTAQEIGEKVKRIVDRENNKTEGDVSLLPDLKSTSVVSARNCYEITGGLEDAKFATTGSGSINPKCTYDTLSACKVNAKADTSSSTNQFQVYCIMGVSNNLLIGKVVVGQINCKTLKSSSECVIPNYEYTVVTKLNGSYLCGNNKCDSLYGETPVSCPLDCAGPSCHNAIIETPEQCDFTTSGVPMLNGQSCTTLNMGFTGGTLGCTSTNCMFNTGGCTNVPQGPVCGNDVIETGEACESTVNPTVSCKSLNSKLYSSGLANCVSCQFDVSECRLIKIVPIEEEPIVPQGVDPKGGDLLLN